ncbi:MAG TPA: hypothetical protein VK809_02800 [Bacteroidia bacterium]|jgi:hypothetical protein|nr:hypothetical protein [Bacteroidia bacterium]
MKEAIHVISLNVAELEEKLHIKLADIILIEADEPDSRNKVAYIKNEDREYTLMNVAFKKLLTRTNNLIMVNKHTLVSLDAVKTHRHDCITLKDLFKGWLNKQITLSRKCRPEFYSRIEG